MEPWNLVLVSAVVVGLAMILVGALGRERARQATRLASIERKLDAVLTHLGVTVPEPGEPDVVQLLERGRKVEAIKTLREHTGMELIDAKAAVERIARERGIDPG